MEEIQNSEQARLALKSWQRAIETNYYTYDDDLIHTIQYHFGSNFSIVHEDLKQWGDTIRARLAPLVLENHLPMNLPYLQHDDALGERIDRIVHHPYYHQAGDLIYGTNLLSYLMPPESSLLRTLSLFFLSSQTGEAGHHCPIACSAGLIRILQKVPDFPNKLFYLEKLITPSYQYNFTGAQFITEIQGGSDVGLNATRATLNKTVWRIVGEKWFCSNADADLFLVTARYDSSRVGTSGLGLFLVPAIWQGVRNHFNIRRLKNKLGTQTMATAEINFDGALAIPMGLENGFHLAIENVLHISRLFNSFCVLAMARRSYKIAFEYAKHRVAFSKAIIHYPLIIENLAKIKTENTAMLAAIFSTAHLQEQSDRNETPAIKLLLRLLVNMQKYLSSKWSVQHVHHAIDVLAGNGIIETFSPLPRLLKDCIVCENWEGTHNVLRLQILKDILKYDIDKIYLAYVQDELNQLTSPLSNVLKQSLKQLEHQLMLFRSLDAPLQALEIQKVVDAMAILFCALRLLHEALDQQKYTARASKLDYFEFFSLMHLNPASQLGPYSHDYMTLITKIVS